MYQITSSYHWYQLEKERYIVKVFFINTVPFTFNELIEIEQQNPDILEEANNGKIYTPEIFFSSSFYLIDEECHPCLFELDLENPEAMNEIDNEFQME